MRTPRTPAATAALLAMTLTLAACASPDPIVLPAPERNVPEAAAPDLTALTSTRLPDGQTWTLDTSGVADAAANLAAELGLSPAGDLTFATPAASQEPLAELTVQQDGSWYYFQDLGGYWFECAGPEPQTGCALLDRTISTQEAEQAATGWFARLERAGVLTTIGPLNVSTDFGAYVTAALTVDSTPTDIIFSVGFGATPEGLQAAYAYGTLATVEPARTVRTVDARTAAIRSSELLGGWRSGAEPDATDIVVEGAETIALFSRDVDGTMWLLPGWVYTTTAGNFVATAVDPEDLQVATRTAPSAADVAADVVGMTEQQAGETLDTAGIVWRVIERDGETFMTTTDFLPDRANLTIEDGIVREVEMG